MINNAANEAPKKVEPIAKQETFADLGIDPKILEVLTRLQLTKPTPIQHKAIPVAIKGNDVVGIAQTGTGKSLAFGLPMIQILMHAEKGRGLIILPTRELALQINDTLMKIAGSFGMKTAVLIGGAPMYGQTNALRNNPDVIIGTPGRINDHITRRNLSLHDITILILDEADLMFDMGFAAQIKAFLQMMPKERQTMLFSATMPAEIMKVATTYMKSPLRVEIAPQGTGAEKVEHELFFVKKESKTKLLQKLLGEYKGSVLVFSRTKHGAKRICQDINKMGYNATEIHSNRSLGQRKEALDGFKTGKYKVLVATDIASRGIDVKGIELVLNFDIPESPDDYVHRAGRTGRAGMAGKSILFVMPEQRGKVRQIERLMRAFIPVSPLPEMPYVPSTPPTPQQMNTYKKNVGMDEGVRTNSGGYRGNRTGRVGHGGYGNKPYGNKPFKKRFSR